jgi:hypothetical protein
MIGSFRACCVAPVLGLAMVAPASAAVVYDGELLEAGAPANGIFDFRFRCFDTTDGGSQIGITIEQDDVRVSNGGFSVELDFGSDDICGASDWLETEVARSDRIGGFTRLQPRQPMPASLNLDGTESVPAGAVVFFSLDQCPTGWSEYTAARGRAIVGRQPSGTLGGTYGEPLTDLEEREHHHEYSISTLTTNDGYHGHIWASIQNVGGDIQWTSYAAGGVPDLVFVWSNGIGNEGSGIYPLAAQPNATFYTSRGGQHSHGVYVPPTSTTPSPNDVPYIQLLACTKD